MPPQRLPDDPERTTWREQKDSIGTLASALAELVLGNEPGQPGGPSPGLATFFGVAPGAKRALANVRRKLPNFVNKTEKKVPDTAFLDFSDYPNDRTKLARYTEDRRKLSENYPGVETIPISSPSLPGGPSKRSAEENIITHVLQDLWDRKGDIFWGKNVEDLSPAWQRLYKAMLQKAKAVDSTTSGGLAPDFGDYEKSYFHIIPSMLADTMLARSIKRPSSRSSFLPPE